MTINNEEEINSNSKINCKLLDEKKYGEIFIEYKNDNSKIIKNNEGIRLFGDLFVVNNKRNVSLIIEGKDFCLKKYHKFESKKNLKISLIIKSKKIDMSYMFDNCENLISVEGISKLKDIKIINISNMFNNCISLESLPDISDLDTSNLEGASDVFNNCHFLNLSLDLRNWGIQRNMKTKNKSFLILTFNEYSIIKNKLEKINEGNKNQIIDKKNIESSFINSNENMEIPNYLNPIFLCFYNTKLLTNHLLNKKYVNNILNDINKNCNNFSLIRAYYYFISNLNKNNINNYTFIKLNNIFKYNNESNDGKNIIINFLNQVHREEIIIKYLYNEQNNNNESHTKELDTRQINLKNYLDFINKSKTIITELFLIIIEKMKICQNCKNKKNIIDNYKKYEYKSKYCFVF